MQSYDQSGGRTFLELFKSRDWSCDQSCDRKTSRATSRLVPWLVVAPVRRPHDMTCDNHDWSCDKLWDQSWRSCDWSCDWSYMTDDFSCISSQDRWDWSYVGLSQCDRLRGRRSNTPLVLRPPHSALAVRSQGRTIWCDWGFSYWLAQQLLTAMSCTSVHALCMGSNAVKLARGLADWPSLKINRPRT